MAPRLSPLTRTSAVTNPRQLAPTVGLSRDGFRFLEGRFEGLEGYAVGRMTKSRRGKLYIDSTGWGPDAGSIEYGYRVPFGGIHVFVGKIGEPGPELGVCADLVETAQCMRSTLVKPTRKHAFVGVIHGGSYEEGSESGDETAIYSGDETSTGETESLYQLQDDRIGGGSDGNSIPDPSDLPYRVGIFMAGTQAAPRSSTAAAAISGSAAATAARAGGPTGSPAQVLSDLFDALAALMAEANPVDQEVHNAEIAKVREQITRAKAELAAEEIRMTAERAALDAQAYRLMMDQKASQEVLKRKSRSRLPAALDARNLFNTPGVNRAEATAGAPVQHRIINLPRHNTDTPPAMPTPSGHYSNPMDNLVAAAARLEAIPIEGDSPQDVETRRVKELLRTALVQQEAYSQSRDRIHSTPRPSRSHSRRMEEPAVSSNARREALRGNNPAGVDNAQENVDRAHAQEAGLAAQHQARQLTPIFPAATVEPGVVSSSLGVPCLVPALRNVRLPKDFKGPRKVPNYTADQPPETWVESYEMAMEMLDVDDTACAKYFTMMLEGTARTWIKSLPPNSISSWAQLRARFIKNFKDTCKQPMSIVDLAACVQQEGESTTHWVRRVSEVLHSSDRINADTAVVLLESNCRFGPLKLKLGRMKRDCTDIGTLMTALVKYADSDSTKDPDSGDDKAGKGKKNSNTKGQQHRPTGNGGGGKRKPDGSMDFVANTSAQNKGQRRKGKQPSFRANPGPNPERLNFFLNQPCPKHGTKEEPATHLWKDCYIMKEFKSSNTFQYDHSSGGGSGSGSGYGGGSSGPGFQGNPGGQDSLNNQSNQSGYEQQQSGYQNNPKQLSGGQYHVFTTSLDKRDRKLQRRAVSAVEPATPHYLRWSEQPIIWSREDHPPRVYNPVQLALVVAPQVGGYKLTKVLMDGGSSINILYYDTFHRMGLTDKDLRPSNTVFHGVVPGKSAYPVGKIALEVVFGDDHDSRSETITLEVVKIQSPYHALFGRPAYAKFMARPCYVYLQLKMPGHKGTITVHGSRRIALECEEGDAAYAESVCATAELKYYKDNVDPMDMTPLKKPTTEHDPTLKFTSAAETKLVEFVAGDPSKRFSISANLDPK